MQCCLFVCHGLVFTVTVTAFQAISGEESLPGPGARDAVRQDASHSGA